MYRYRPSGVWTLYLTLGCSICCHNSLIRRISSLKRKKHLKNICQRTICLSLRFFQCLPSIQELMHLYVFACGLIISSLSQPLWGITLWHTRCGGKEVLSGSKFPRHATDSFNKSNYFSKCLCILMPRGGFQVFFKLVRACRSSGHPERSSQRDGALMHHLTGKIWRFSNERIWSLISVTFHSH